MYEHGLKNNIRKPFAGYYNETKTLWDGQPFDGTLLVYGEQGLGDQINFGTLLKDLLNVKQDVIVKVVERLKEIFSNTYPEIRVYGEDDIVPTKTMKNT